MRRTLSTTRAPPPRASVTRARAGVAAGAPRPHPGATGSGGGAGAAGALGPAGAAGGNVPCPADAPACNGAPRPAAGSARGKGQIPGVVGCAVQHWFAVRAQAELTGVGLTDDGQPSPAEPPREFLVVA